MKFQPETKVRIKNCEHSGVFKNDIGIVKDYLKEHKGYAVEVRNLTVFVKESELEAI